MSAGVSPLSSRPQESKAARAPGKASALLRRKIRITAFVGFWVTFLDNLP
jgi:hypothetical protein